MFDGLKTSMAVLIGLILGVAVAAPLAWYGTRLGADSLAHNIDRNVLAVEERQQAMADQALKLEELLVEKGYNDGAAVFAQVMDARSRLAGLASTQVAEKLAALQALEQTLLLSEKVWEHAGKDAQVRQSYYYAEHGRLWEKQKRQLVVEQQDLIDSVSELNHLHARWPASVLLGYKTFGAMVNAFFGDVTGNLAYFVRLGLDWVGYGARKLAALTGQKEPPDAPKWERPKAAVTEGYMDPLVLPRFLAAAPPPEDSYDELQYAHETPNYADVDLGKDKPVLENRSAPEGYQIVLPKPQATVTY